MNSQSEARLQSNNMVIRPGLGISSSSGTDQERNNQASAKELAELLSSLVIKMEDKQSVDEPPKFKRAWIESSEVMIARYLKGKVSEWHLGASLLYKEWEVYKLAFLKNFDDSKNRIDAKKYLSRYNIYEEQAIIAFGKITRIFEIAKIMDDTERCEIILEKLSDEDYDKIYGLKITTF
ncbi:hypothetical protein BB558_003138 [Smittium angustum]|uniref:Uncharacterized protein n=1 Tax=Smittium angustum TaxID=133377 RepID=A0A2U1J709_SMIAN|nr:hypothetical protein BB558_003138 [Smittium angustum]